MAGIIFFNCKKLVSHMDQFIEQIKLTPQITKSNPFDQMRKFIFNLGSKKW